MNFDDCFDILSARMAHPQVQGAFNVNRTTKDAGFLSENILPDAKFMPVSELLGKTAHELVVYFKRLQEARINVS